MSSIPVARRMTFEYAVAERQSPLVRRVIARNPSEFTLYGTNTFIVGTDSLAIVDPGPAIDEHVDAVLSATGDKPVGHILVTHTHRDHSPAAEILKAETGAVTCAFGSHPTGRKEDGGGAPVPDGADVAFSPDIELQDGDVISGGDWNIEAVHTPGHMSNHTCYALREESLLFSGDHLMAWATSVISPPDGCLEAYMNSLRKLLSRPETVYYPSHGPAIARPRQVVEAHIAHREARTGQILTCLSERAMRIAELVAIIYEDLDPRLMEAAGLSVLAHLLYLRDQGIVRAAEREVRSAVWSLSRAGAASG